jgi:aspartyl-tRNA(Asn)/glutamyl-tRNA(Gln) amidotransferase subunit A
VTVKDIIDVAWAPTRAGSAVYERVPRVDAEAVARLRAAGAVIIAKVSTHEFALGVTTPQSRNPHDRARIPGGSSGGSAIAVSTGMGLASLATDTRASIRVPAAFCGVVGLKPTYGLVPTSGIVPNSWTMDHIGPLARTVADAATILEALTVGRSRLHAWVGSPVEGLRIGVPAAAFAGIDPGVDAGVRAALAAAEGLGCGVTEARRPAAADLDDANAAGMIVSRCEAATFHRSLGADRSRYWQEVADQLAAAGTVPAIDYLDAQRLRADLTEGLLAAFEHHDVLAMPTVPIVAPPVEDFARYLLVLSRNTTLWSLTGFPAISIPCGTAGGLPFGLQLVAPPWREDLLIALGSALEAAASVPASAPEPVRGEVASGLT